jgi:hypothetical protein
METDKEKSTRSPSFHQMSTPDFKHQVATKNYQHWTLEEDKVNSHRPNNKRTQMALDWTHSS